MISAKNATAELSKNPTTGLVLDVFGPTVEFLISPDDDESDFCLIKGVIPPGAMVPLHSHADTEDFLILSGRIEGLRLGSDDVEWITAAAGDHIHVPNNAPHAWRNVFDEPCVSFMITTKKMGRFFRTVGRPMTGDSRPPTPEEMARFAEVSAEFGYWNATPDENAAVGLQMSF